VSTSSRFVPSVAPLADGDALWIGIRGMDVLVLDRGDHDELPTASEAEALGIAPVRSLYLGELDGVPCRSAELPEDHDAPPGMAFRTLRDLYGRIDEHLWTLAGRAAQLVEWDRTHVHCGRCGSPTEHAPGERARRCPQCGHAAFPRLSPAVIVRVTRGDEILLARAQRFPGGMYSVLAGFVEPGESLEECVARELEEEVGIEVADITYFASQPWPFPHSLMIGFTATWVSGDLRIEEAELVDARWFTRDNLPDLPGRLSIARTLIDDWL
jgi:NAD+ diphosphatase